MTGAVFESLPSSVMPDLIRHPATPRLRREGVFRDQGLDRAGFRLKAGMTALNISPAP
ncbi:hypothetical protein L901_26575 [Agrobacterium sp. D14]|nr:hypothetical protein L901_26575 [Agrobacterium sp. D14]